LLSNTEFSDRKRALMIEKDTIVQQLNQTGSNNSEWANIAREVFDFGLLAHKRFGGKDPEVKKVIFKTISLKSTLLDQKLQYQLRFVFLKIKEGIKKTNDEIDRLEPQKSPSNQANLKNYLKSSVWCG